MVFSPILLLNILNYITHKPLPFKREKPGAGICSLTKLSSGLGLRSLLSRNISRHNTALLTEGITDIIITAKRTLQHEAFF